jgi:hypothetical protein
LYLTRSLRVISGQKESKRYDWQVCGTFIGNGK